MDSRGVVCSKLSLDVIEHVLSFLSVPDLCRQSRVVCKAWDELVGKARYLDLSYALDKENLFADLQLRSYLLKIHLLDL